MFVLGLSFYYHDSSAALIQDGKIVAAAEEERFSRVKHAFGQNPVLAAKFCLERAGLKPGDIDLIAYPWSGQILEEKRWEYAKRAFPKTPSKALRAFTKLKRLQKRRIGALHATLDALGIDRGVETALVEHHLAHASSAFHLSGFESAAILTADGEGEVTSTLMGEGRADGTIVKLKEILKPDSLGLLYSTMTEYLGFQSMNGEYKVMGMAPFGDPAKCDLGDLVKPTPAGFRCDDERVWVARKNRYRGKHYSQRMVDELGPPRQGDGLSEPYIHVAAATQKMLEDVVLHLLDTHLAEPLKRRWSWAAASARAAWPRRSPRPGRSPRRSRPAARRAARRAGGR